MDQINALMQDGEYHAAAQLLSITIQGEREKLNGNVGHLIQSLIILLTMDEQFEEALSLFKEHKIPKNELTFERAYCLYRIERFQSALNVLASSVCKRTTALKAQVLFRLNRFEEAASIYAELMSSEKDSSLRDRYITNYFAMCSFIPHYSTTNASSASFPSYEAQYNYGCYLLTAKGQLEEAHNHLTLALQWALQTLTNEGLTEEEISAETLQMKLQIAYCLGRMTRCEEAISINEQYSNGSAIPNRIAKYNVEILKNYQGRIDHLPPLTRSKNLMEHGKLNTVQLQYINFNMAISRKDFKSLKKLSDSALLGPLAASYLCYMIEGYFRQGNSHCLTAAIISGYKPSSSISGELCRQLTSTPLLTICAAYYLNIPFSELLSTPEQKSIELMATVYHNLSLEGNLKNAINSCEALKRMGYNEDLIRENMLFLEQLL